MSTAALCLLWAAWIDLILLLWIVWERQSVRLDQITPAELEADQDARAW